jgi:hypothetical protein
MYYPEMALAIRIIEKRNGMDKYQNKYPAPTARASWWNYASRGIYFITVCTENRVHYFGAIEDGNLVFMTILFVMGMNIYAFKDTFWKIQRIGLRLAIKSLTPPSFAKAMAGKARLTPHVSP